jgi:hypothetical protein
MRLKNSCTVVGMALGALTCCCATTIQPKTSLKDQLELSVHIANGTIPDRSMVEVSLSLLNRSPQPVEACLTRAEGFNLVGSSAAIGGGLGAGAISVHPTCAKRFILPVGKALMWPESVDLPSVGVGPARLSLWVQVVDPTRCDEYGCDYTSVSSNPIEIAITN